MGLDAECRSVTTFYGHSVGTECPYRLRTASCGMVQVLVCATCAFFWLTGHRAHPGMVRLRLDSGVALRVHRIRSVARQFGDKLIHRAAHQCIDNACTGFAVAIRVGRTGGVLPENFVIKQSVHAIDDCVCLGAHQAYGARCDGFRTLGDIAHDQHRLAQRWRFFLHAPGVGEDDVGTLHQAHERQVVQRLDQVHVGQFAQVLGHRPQHIGVQVYRIDNLHIVAFGQLGQRLADIQEAIAEILATMPCDHQNLALRHQKRELAIKCVAQLAVAVDSLSGQLQRVDHGVAGHKRHTLQAFAQHVAAGLGSGCKQVIGDQVDATTVHLFRPGLTDVASTQARFDVADGYAPVKRRHSRNHCRRGVTVNQNLVRLHVIQNRVDGGVKRCRQGVQGLLGAHHVEAVISLELEHVQHLLQHALVLPGDADSRIDTRLCGQCSDQRCHLDGFWTSAEN
ncbi:hypothetical protein ALO86_100988 [Pseudomonas syringae pv. berberidis]|nr:hypothetical protein ALO86_100988 [Pseudomonas syringae pv. berberidis]RMM25870.1 hypothetical protein ALQ83_101148 [Pseudomonas syringae pv. berberidis]